MAKLFGAQRMVLQAVNDLPKNAAGFVADSQITQATQISESDVRDWLDTLDGEGLIEVARTTAGLSASITAKGRLQLILYQPVSTSQGGADGPAAAGSVQPSPSVSSPATVSGEPSPSINASTPPLVPSPPLSPSSGSLTAPSAAGDVDGYQVVLLIHGIRTQADWGPMVRSKLEVPGQIHVIPIKYGYFDAFRFWFPFWTRNRPVEKVYVQIRVALQKYRKTHPDAKLSIIAHSFGNYVVGELLKRDFELKIHRLLLCGSVLPQDFPWHQYQGRFDDDKVINECGKADIWPVLAQSASWGYGASGTHGFGAVLVKDRFHAGGHGQYFEPEFVEKYWEPFVRRGEYEGSEFEKKMPPTPWWISILGIMPLRWLAVSPIILITWAAGYTMSIHTWSTSSGRSVETNKLVSQAPSQSSGSQMEKKKSSECQSRMLEIVNVLSVHSNITLNDWSSVRTNAIEGERPKHKEFVKERLDTLIDALIDQHHDKGGVLLKARRSLEELQAILVPNPSPDKTFNVVIKGRYESTSYPSYELSQSDFEKIHSIKESLRAAVLFLNEASNN
jgi:hypothetical protein